MSILKKVVGGAKAVVSKVKDTVQDTAKLGVNTVVPFKNPYSSDDFKTGFGKVGSKVQDFTDKASVVVGTALVASKLSGAGQKPEALAQDATFANPGVPQITETVTANITSGGIIPGGLIEVGNSKVVADASNANQNMLLGNLFKTDAQGGSVVGSLLRGVAQNAAGQLANKVLNQPPSSPQVQQVLQTAQSAAIQTNKLLDMGGQIPLPQKPQDTPPWYKTTGAIIGFVVGGIIVLGLIVRSFFGRRRR
jgi:hypothetical protein